MKNNLFGQLACIGMFAGLSPFAEARIGETKAECIARYGEGSAYPTITREQLSKLNKELQDHTGETTPEETDEGFTSFKKAGYEIVIGFKNDRAVRIQYTKNERESLISKEELYSILLANGSDKKWIMHAGKMFPFSPTKPGDPYPNALVLWTDDGDLRAICQIDGGFGAIVIMKSNLLPRFAPKLTEQQKELVQGL
jgi:hypothetical protein